MADKTISDFSISPVAAADLKHGYRSREHGYRSRAAWKLVQLDSKFGFLRSSRAVLDLCAAPGGWMQVAVELVPVGSLVIGVDLDPIRPIRGAIAVQEDITTTKCKSTVKKLMAEYGSRAFDFYFVPSEVATFFEIRRIFSLKHKVISNWAKASLSLPKNHETRSIDFFDIDFYFLFDSGF